MHYVTVQQMVGGLPNNRQAEPTVRLHLECHECPVTVCFLSLVSFSNLMYRFVSVRLYLLISSGVSVCFLCLESGLTIFHTGLCLSVYAV